VSPASRTSSSSMRSREPYPDSRGRRSTRAEKGDTENVTEAFTQGARPEESRNGSPPNGASPGAMRSIVTLTINPAVGLVGDVETPPARETGQVHACRLPRERSASAIVVRQVGRNRERRPLAYGFPPPGVVLGNVRARRRRQQGMHRAGRNSAELVTVARLTDVRRMCPPPSPKAPSISISESGPGTADMATVYAPFSRFE
jgi:hypothetical protein